MTTRELASWLAVRLQDGSDLAFLIGAPTVLLLTSSSVATSNGRYRGSRFPHALVRGPCWPSSSIGLMACLSNHPYHRD